MIDDPEVTQRRDLPHYLVSTLDGDSFTLAGEEGHHARSVRRIRVNERICLTDGRGGWAVGCVDGFPGRGQVSGHIEDRGHQPIASPPITVVQALIKGDRSTLAVELLTEVGVDHIVPWEADRSVVRWHGERAARGRQRWQRAAQESAKQSRRLHVPQIHPAITSENLAEVLDCAGSKVVCHENAPTAITQVPISTDSGVVIVVGPEGGISERELDLCAETGAQLVGLGPTVLRASSAGVVAASWVLGATGRWRNHPFRRLNPDTAMDSAT